MFYVVKLFGISEFFLVCYFFCYYELSEVHICILAPAAVSLPQNFSFSRLQNEKVMEGEVMVLSHVLAWVREL
jgi:hypothetical protein